MQGTYLWVPCSSLSKWPDLTGKWPESDAFLLDFRDMSVEGEHLSRVSVGHRHTTFFPMQTAPPFLPPTQSEHQPISNIHSVPLPPFTILHHPAQNTHRPIGSVQQRVGTLFRTCCRTVAYFLQPSRVESPID